MKYKGEFEGFLSHDTEITENKFEILTYWNYYSNSNSHKLKIM